MSSQFIPEQPTPNQWLPGWDVLYDPRETNFPRYCIDYSVSDSKNVVIPKELENFNGFQHNTEKHRISFLVTKGTTFRKSYSNQLFTTDPKTKDFREILLDENSKLNKLKEYVFDPGGMVDPVRTIADITGAKKETVESFITLAKWTAIGGGAYYIYRKVNGKKK